MPVLQANQHHRWDIIKNSINPYKIYIGVVIAATEPGSTDDQAGGGASRMLQEKQRSLLAGLRFQLFIFFLKIFTTSVGGSLTQISDLFRSLSDILSVVFSIICIRKTSRERNDVFQFGYGKLESIASLTVAVVILISCMVVLYGMIMRLQKTTAVGAVGYGALLSVLSLCGNSYFWYRNHRISLKEHSPIMESEWRLFRTKVCANSCVILTLTLSLVFRENPNIIYVDILGSAVVCSIMVSTAYKLLTSSVHDLIDGALDESLQILILQELASFFHEYTQLHGLKCRRSGTEVYINVFLQFDPARPMGDIQSVIDKMKTSMESRIKNSHVFIIPASQTEK